MEYNKWHKIDSAPKEEIDQLDLFGWIDYDQIEMRLTDCQWIGNEWHYFSDGEMLTASTIGFHATHWMVVDEPPA